MIKLERLAYLPNCTIGRLLYGAHSLATIEKQWSDNKPFISCIPQGIYTCKPYSSAKYSNTYEITNVPDRTSILFHAGNWARDVQGCIALGTELNPNEYKINNSRVAMKKFLEHLDGIDEFEIEITQLVMEN